MQSVSTDDGVPVESFNFVGHFSFAEYALELSFGEPVDECSDDVDVSGTAREDEADGKDLQFGSCRLHFAVTHTKDGNHHHVDRIQPAPPSHPIPRHSHHGSGEKKRRPDERFQQHRDIKTSLSYCSDACRCLDCIVTGDMMSP